MSREALPCPDKPLRAKLEVTRQDSDEVLARTESGADGGFRIPLPPGAYMLHPANLTGSVLPAADPMPFKVGPHRFLSVVVRFDSGIR